MPLPDGGMKIVYGTYEHPSGEVAIEKLEAIPQYSPRNRRWFTFYKLHCRGDLQLTPEEDASVIGDPQARQALMATKINAFADAYMYNNKSFGLLDGSGNPTRHYLDENHPNNVSGVRVLYRSWPEGGGDQYVTARSFYFIMGALYQEADSGLYAFTEQVRVHGTAGPIWQWVDNPLLIPIQQQVTAFTRQRIEQYGHLIALDFWAEGNVPPPLFPAWEHQERRIRTFDYPEYFGKKHKLYGLHWQYLMEAPTGQVAIPTIYS